MLTGSALFLGLLSLCCTATMSHPVIMGEGGENTAQEMFESEHLINRCVWHLHP